MASDANERQDEVTGKAYKTDDETSGSLDPRIEQSRARSKNASPRVDHTPPPLLVESGSLIIETDETPTPSGSSSTAHPFRLNFAKPRPIKGLKITDDAGDTIYLNPSADGCSVKIWWNKTKPDEQILIDGATLSIEVDEDLGPGTDLGTGVPSSNPMRFRRFTHSKGTGIAQVEVIKDSKTRFFEDSNRLKDVMIWDTTG